MQGSFLFADIPWFTCMMYGLHMTVQEFTKKHDAEENQSYFDYSLWCTNVINAVWSTAHFVNGDTTVDLKQFIPLLQDAVTAAANDGVTLAVGTIIVVIFSGVWIYLMLLSLSITLLMSSALI
jgi:hypothetical protein